MLETNKVKKECYLIRQDNTHIFNKMFYFFMLETRLKRTLFHKIKTTQYTNFQ